MSPRRCKSSTAGRAARQALETRPASTATRTDASRSRRSSSIVTGSQVALKQCEHQATTSPCPFAETQTEFTRVPESQSSQGSCSTWMRYRARPDGRYNSTASSSSWSSAESCFKSVITWPRRRPHGSALSSGHANTTSFLLQQSTIRLHSPHLPPRGSASLDSGK